ncbi:hypothetical protein DPMN_121889 [Dreissena polymorpha]|uniref:Uncharacterized protein n=1 Tax=Dreissena polymorpha TaxID=45954 RepID=A0A9D4JPV8_DREPO|nr:hypothetical protein DPMN_121887 [Dreissena polymorpha]KAH3820145.1 hypothetical protein DPMN_121889 [Dreissena polymorpha]
MTENQRAQWLLSMPLCIDINNAIQEFCGEEFHTSPQHKEVGTSRSKRDRKGMQTMFSHLEECNPFREDEFLFNIETGVTSHSIVNAHKAETNRQRSRIINGWKERFRN